MFSDGAAEKSAAFSYGDYPVGTRPAGLVINNAQGGDTGEKTNLRKGGGIPMQYEKKAVNSMEAGYGKTA